MSSKTTTRVLDKRGVRLVVGQNVTIEQGGACGQLLGISEQGVCLVRIAATGEVLSLAASAIHVASWDQVKDAKKSSERTKLF